MTTDDQWELMWTRQRAGEYRSGTYRILRGDLANEECVGPVPVPKASWVLYLDVTSRSYLCGTLRQAMDEADLIERTFAEGKTR